MNEFHFIKTLFTCFVHCYKKLDLAIFLFNFAMKIIEKNVDKATSLLTHPKQYCSSLNEYRRFVTREVKVGSIGIGGSNPIRLQSMTTTDTMNTLATVEQSIRMIEAGCELVRITAPSINEAKNLQNIKDELRKRGYQTPLIADIHFTPNAAEAAARIVEKVRVNPGNYADKKRFEELEYTDATYNAELDRIRERFTPLVKICKEYGTAMRIGTNHGSLSDRIMSRYGDSPEGMVESALEFLRICEDLNYHNIVLSMKSSNPKVMVQAYRLLLNRMIETSRNYPLHLGVTEAGEGEDGRIKSAAGIGTLLEDGLGDTVRVSLTEDPEFEIPVAHNLVKRYATRKAGSRIQDLIIPTNFSPFDYKKRTSHQVLNIGGSDSGQQVPRVIADFSTASQITAASFFAVGYTYSPTLDKWNISDQACDFVYTGDRQIEFGLPGTLSIIQNASAWETAPGKDKHYPLFSASEFINATNTHAVLNFVTVDVDHPYIALIQKIAGSKNVVLVAQTHSEHGMAAQRSLFFELLNAEATTPVIIQRLYDNVTQDDFQLFASTDAGALLIDGFGEGLWMHSEGLNRQLINSTVFGALQATRTRISKTEYISCPSCGRTLFDLQETTAKIRSRTNHLKGVKIGIMGCIVNGPGEMADADYGYVGSGPGKITLYKVREVVTKSIAAEQAVDALIQLIQDHGDWVEPKLD